MKMSKEQQKRLSNIYEELPKAKEGETMTKKRSWIMYALYDFDKPYEIAFSKHHLIRLREISIKRGWKKENMNIKKVRVTEL